MIPPSIKNIIFDLGGVLININYQITLDEFRKLGYKHIDETYNQNNQLPFFDKYDKGEISSEEFVTEIANVLDNGTTKEQIIKAWNAMLLDFPKERADLLLELKGKYRTFLLSNTNELHIDYYFNKLRTEYGYNGMKDFFEKDYYSHIIGMRKPNPEIFEFVLNQNGLKASETFFIDDTLQHVEGARKVGINAYHLVKPNTIIDLFT